MNDFSGKYEPSPEFLARLDRDIDRAWRSDQLFGAPATPVRTRRLAMVFGIAAGAVLTLATGMVLGASASYASAAVLDASWREANTKTLASTRLALVGQLDPARADFDRVRAAFEKGAATRTALSAAKARVDTLEASIGRIDGDLSASRATTPPPRSALAILPIKNVVNALACAQATVAPQTSQGVPPQQVVPIVELSPPTAKTTQTLGAVLGIKEAPDGRLLVNDAGRRLMRLFAPSLATSTVVLDSVPGSARSYGWAPRPLTPFVGDSMLIADQESPNGMLVLDARGQVVRALALPPEIRLWRSPAGVDSKGRLLYKFTPPEVRATVPQASTVLPPPDPASGGGGRGGGGAGGVPMTTGLVSDSPDTIPIHRFDLDTRRIDTAAYVLEPRDGATYTENGGGKTVLVLGKNGEPAAIKQIINPLYAIDEWAVLSDGTIAVVRGRDYHVDWIHPDGTRSASPKLPFEWKRLTDADKQRLVDSTRSRVDSLDSLVALQGAISAAARARCPRGSVCGDSMEKANAFAPGGRGRGGSAAARLPIRRIFPYEIVPLSQIADYWPPIGHGAALPDRDGNLWILPKTSTQSKQNELVYDVVNPERGLIQRVRVPAGRSIAGFGKGGVVYLQAGDVKNGFILERTTVPSVKPATPTPK